MTMSRPIQANRYQQNAVKPRFTIKGIYIVRLLVGFFLTLNIVLIITILFSSSGLPGYRIQNQQVNQLEKNVLKLRTQNQKLFEMIQSLKTSPKARERLVRRQLGWVHENEIVLQFPNKENEDDGYAGLPVKPFGLPR